MLICEKIHCEYVATHHREKRYDNPKSNNEYHHHRYSTCRVYEFLLKVIHQYFIKVWLRYNGWYVESHKYPDFYTMFFDFMKLWEYGLENLELGFWWFIFVHSECSWWDDKCFFAREVHLTSSHILLRSSTDDCERHLEEELLFFVYEKDRALRVSWRFLEW